MAIKFPSISRITYLASISVHRFPLVLISGIVATFCSMVLFEIEDGSEGTLFYNYLATATAISFLGISVFFAIDVFSERSGISMQKKVIARLCGVVLLVGYFILIGDRFADGPAQIRVQYALIALSTHLLVAFAPFIYSGSVDEFWEFNKSLFLHFLISSFFAAVLYIGMVIALVAIENLLEIGLNDDIFFHLFVFMCGIFITWSFISGIPELHKGVAIQPYLRFLKIFVQYVLIPLVTVYILILYLYLGKIIIEWELPDGWVSYLVLSFSIAGILSLLLLHPIQHKEDNTWIQVYSKGYYLALIPLIGLLMVSIYTRISEYGVTINRYLVATLGVWLTGIVLYFIFSRTKNIKAIPVSLCLTAFLVSFGPLGASSVSERSQLGRFEEILSQNNLLDEENEIIPATSEISFTSRKELSSIIDYLAEYHGMDVFSEYVGRDIEFVLEDSTIVSGVGSDGRLPGSDSGKFMAFMGMEYVSRWSEESEAEERQFFSYEISEEELLPIAGYDRMFTAIYYLYNQESILREFDGYTLLFEGKSQRLILSSEDNGAVLDFDIIGLLDGFERNADLARQLFTSAELSIVEESEEFKARIIFDKIAGSEGDSTTIQTLNLTVLIRDK